MRKIWIVLFLVATVALMQVSLFAQGGSGSIGGLVLDPAGAAVPNAKVTVTNLATNIATHVKSSGEGRYLAPQLPPGTYEIGVEFTGFKKYVGSGIVVQVDDKLTINASLSLGSSSETVTVNAEAPPLRTEDAQAGEVVNNNFIMNLPQIDRNPFELLRISGNVQGAENGISPNSQSQVRINGGRTQSVDYFVDGAVVTTGRGHSLSNQTPSIDAVQEFKVVTSGISAEFGRISGGYVTLVTKSGSNSYHGNVYEYMFNDMFDANSWQQNAIGNPKVHFRQNDYGFTLGGPITIPKIYNGKNKTFFFVDNEYFKYNQAGQQILMSVPTMDERSGNMTNTIAGGLATMMYDPNGPQSSTPNADGTYSRLALLGGNGKVVPATQISPTSAAILALLPQSNRPTVAGYSSLNNYQAPQSTTQSNFRFGVRLDHSITDNQRIAIHYTTFSSDFGQSRVGGPLFTSATTNTEGGLNGTINYDWTLRPTLLFNFRAAAIHNPLQTGNALPSGFDSSIIKLNPAFQSILGNGAIPNIQEDFQAGGYYGRSPTDNITNSTTYDFAFTGTKIAGRHIIKFGYETRRYYDNFRSFGGANTVTFMGNPVAPTTGDHGFGAASSIPNSMGSFLLGINNWNTVSGPSTRAMDTNYNAAFVQDDFKVTPKLTVNVGLRWDRESPTSERHDKIYFWDANASPLFTINPGWTWAGELAAAGLPANTPTPSWVTNGLPKGAVELPNTPAFPSRSFQGVNSHQLAPRLGLAYQIDSKTVVRASAGLMYIPTTGDAGGYSSSNSSLPLGNAGNAGWHASNDGQRHFISTWANPFPLPGMVTSYTRDTLLANQESSADPGVTAFNQNMHMPREYTWTASVQRQLPQNFVLEASYSGNRGLGLLAPDLISRYPKSLLSPSYASAMTTSVTSPNAGQTLSNNITGPTQLLALLEYAYPYYGPVNVLGSNLGSSFYNAFNMRLEHRLTHGLSFLLNYTYSRLLDNVGGPEASTGGGLTSGGLGAKRPQSVDTFASTWGISANDQTHRLSMAYIYEVPLGRGRHWLGTPQTFTQKALDKVAGGWQFSGNSVYVSGAPIPLDQSTTVNINNTIKDETTFGSWTSSNHNLSNPAYTGDGQVLVSPITSVTASTIGRFDTTKVTPAQSFTYGNLSPILASIRNPSFYQTDLSIMKNFYLHSESRYLQIRAEGQNAFNIRGFGTYNTRIGDPYFGLITGAGNSPRQIQMSARIIF